MTTKTEYRVTEILDDGSAGQQWTEFATSPEALRKLYNDDCVANGVQELNLRIEPTDQPA